MRHSLLALLALPLVAAEAGGAPVTVTVSGVAAATGRVRVEICPEADYLKPNCPYAAWVPASAGPVTVTIEGVPPGTYGAQGYWDRNGNGRLDRNMIGVPTEQLGFSNDARIRMAPPRFASVAFQHGSTPQRIAFTVRKVL